jgi:DNA topoisomerase-3
MNTSEKSSNDIPKILMVAEKPSIAKAIAEALSRGNRPPRQRQGISRALPVYEFTTNDFAPVNSKCLVRVTSVVGHVYSLGFDVDQKERQRDPRDYFSLPVAKKEEGTTSKLRVVDHLKALSGDSEHLVPIDTLSSVQCVF